VRLCPPSRQQQYNDELSALQQAAAARAQKAPDAAARTRRDGITFHKSCTIEEVVEDPMEEQQVGWSWF